MLENSSRLGPYEIIAPLGAGGMGEVYRARDTRLAREVAVKVLSERFAGDADLLSRFEREAQAVASLSHPNILAIHDYGTQGTSTYAVMELLEGQTLRDRLSKGALPWRKAAEIAVAIAEGLAAAHAKGITHRDLKPENLFLTTGGSVKILDFGLAQIKPLAGGLDATSPPGSSHTEPGAILGTVGYMAPEQVRGQPADVRSDIFSLGCVIYEMVTGQRAFARDTAAETMTSILHDEPPEIRLFGKHVPMEVERIIHHCLEKNRDERFQSARDLAFALNAILSDSRVASTPSSAQRHAPQQASSTILQSLLHSAFRPPTASELVVIGIMAAFCMVALAVFFATLPRFRASIGASAVKKAGPTFSSLAILPLANVANDANSESLCEGLAEHLSSQLSQVRQLKVRPITSTVHYSQKKSDAKTVGRELEVEAVVTGRLRQEGQSLVVSLELVDARDNSLVWSHRYTGSRQQILDLQDDLARDLAAKLGLRLSADEKRQLVKRDTQDAEAYLLYREGMYHWHKFTEDGLKTAIEYFERATDKDPNYAPAHMGLGMCYQALGSYHWPPKENLPKGRRFLERALQLDSSLTTAHAGLALDHMIYERNWPAAERELQHALSLDRRSFAAHNLQGYYLAAMGRLPEAVAAQKKALEVDPLAPILSADLADAYYFARQYDQAIVQCQATMALAPQFPFTYETLGLAYAQEAKYESAVEALQKAASFRNDHAMPLAKLGYIYARSGKSAEAEEVLQQLSELAQTRTFVFGLDFGKAMIHAGLRQNDDAIASLRQAYHAGEPSLIFLKVDPLWDNLRSDPRFDSLLQEMRLAEKPTPTRSVSEGSGQPIDSVAVLPLENIGDDPKTEFLSDGVADQIINSLLQVRRRNLKVRPFTSVARYKRQKPDLRTVASDLNVQAIVTGSLRQQQDDLSIGIEIVDAREDNVLWSKRYQGQLSRILDLQDQIARDVAANLRMQLTLDEEQRLTKRYTQDPTAYLRYQEGMYHWHKFTEESLRTAIDYFQRALQVDPRFARAHEGLGRCYSIQDAAFSLPPKETLPKAKEAYEKALELDRSLADAHAGLGLFFMFYEHNWPAAEGAFKEALRHDPRSADAHHLYGFYLAAMGQSAPAINELKIAKELDPRAPMRSTGLALVHCWARQYDQQLAESQMTLQLAPDFSLAHFNLGKAYALQGNYEKAAQTFQNQLTADKKLAFPLGMLGYTYARWGKRAEAEKVLQEITTLSAQQYFSGFERARIYAGLADNDQALQWLEKAYEERDWGMAWLKVDPTLDNLRSDPRFQKIIADMHFPP